MATIPEIPLTRLDNADPALMEELLDTVARIAERAAFTLGAEVEGFEAELAAYCGTGHAIGVSSGTDALTLTLRALGVGAGAEVLLPANSFIATAEAVTLAGATPRFLDVDPESGLITAEIVEEALGPRTRCVIPVHLYGRTVEMDPIVALGRERSLMLVEDACQAHGALLGGRRAGSIGDAGCFSFYPAKNLGAWGDGGAVVTDDGQLAERIRLMRSHGELTRYHHELPGTTARLDALQAAILRVKLRRLEDWNASRRRVAGALTDALQDSPVITPAPVQDGMDHVYHQFVVQSESRDALRSHLAAAGVPSAIHYPVPIHRTRAYAQIHAGRAPLPVTEGLAERIVSLPMHPMLSEAEIAQIGAAVRSFER